MSKASHGHDERTVYEIVITRKNGAGSAVPIDSNIASAVPMPSNANSTGPIHSPMPAIRAMAGGSAGVGVFAPK